MELLSTQGDTGGWMDGLPALMATQLNHKEFLGDSCTLDPGLLIQQVKGNRRHQYLILPNASDDLPGLAATAQGSMLGYREIPS